LGPTGDWLRREESEVAEPRVCVPNPQLKWARLQKGWSHAELAEQIKQSVERAGEDAAGVTADMVGRWETGERGTRQRYRKHLVLVFGKPAAELGLLSADELKCRPPEDNQPLEQLRSMLAMAQGSSDDDAFSRNTFLRLFLGACASVLLPGTTLPGWGGGPIKAAGLEAEVDGQTFVAYEAAVDAQAQLYWTVPAQHLFESALGHTRLGMELLRSASGDSRRSLATATARSALLCGRLAFFDLGDPVGGERCFDTALRLVQEGDDHAVAAAICAHQAFIPGFRCREVETAHALEAAAAHVRYGGGPLLRSWVHAVKGELAVRAGDTKRGLAALRQAEDALDAGGADPAWLDFYDRSRLAGFLGYAQLHAGRHADAAATFETALSELAPRAAKQRAVLLLDLANAYVPIDAKTAFDHASQALEGMSREVYAAARDRLPGLRAALQTTPYAAEFNERSRALVPTLF
jgi:transcriptional regulator with XRE-family HTH domain/tetratricopeptide (TPR) repeat protein